MDTAEMLALVADVYESAADHRAVEARMVELAGSIEAAPAGLHFARSLAFRTSGDIRAALAACTLMLAAAEREGDPGWRSNALSLRAMLRILLSDSDLAEHDVDAVLRDLTDAGAEVAAGVEDQLVAGKAHTGIAIGYYMLRLYELADPHYQIAYEVAVHADPDSAMPTICQLNLAELHLTWALELYRVGEAAAAEKHGVIAESHAMRAARDAPADSDYWPTACLMFAGCARAGGDDPAGAADQIRTSAAALLARDDQERWLFSRPFLAIALARSGHHGDAIAVVEDALAQCPAEAGSLTVAALTHTHAMLLAQSGGPELQAVMRYGDGLAGTLWRQRQRTLHAAETLRSYQQLRADHEQVSRSADTDPLTGIANRRAFDRELAFRANGTAGTAAVLVIDLDKLKPLNDTKGHAAGDQALTAIAAILADLIRAGDVLARTGGDEFYAILDGADAGGAAHVAERMVGTVRDLELAVTISIGVAAGPVSAIHDTLNRADQAMYVAKAAGGDRINTAPDPDRAAGAHGTSRGARFG